MVNTVNLLLRDCTAQVGYESFNLSRILGGWRSGGEGGVWYNKTNITPLWGCQYDSLPLVSIANLGLRPRVTMVMRGRQPC